MLGSCGVKQRGHPRHAAALYLACGTGHDGDDGALDKRTPALLGVPWSMRLVVDLATSSLCGTSVAILAVDVAVRSHSSGALHFACEPSGGLPRAS